jgi:hypothetical protein
LKQRQVPLEQTVQEERPLLKVFPVMDALLPVVLFLPRAMAQGLRSTNGNV